MELEKGKAPRHKFSTIIKKATVYQSPLFRLHVAPATFVTKRHAVVVSKKVAKTAVARNKLKRRGRQALAQLLKNSPKLPTLILYLKVPSASLLPPQFKNELHTVLKRAKIL